MKIQKIFSRLAKLATPRHASHSPAPRARLQLESLETRLAPSGLTIGLAVTTPAASVTIAVQCAQ